MLKDIAGRREVEIAMVTADLGAAVRGAELILIPTPAFAQEDIARALAPHLADGQVIYLPPGTFGSVAMMQALRRAGCAADVAFAETGTLPWLTRLHGPAEVAVTMRAVRLPTGVFPGGKVGCGLCRAARRFPLGRADRGCAGRRADECRAHHPPAADPDERRPAGAFRALGHPQRGHPALDPPRHQCAR
jgi:hypothetical protein